MLSGSQLASSTDITYYYARINVVSVINYYVFSIVFV